MNYAFFCSACLGCLCLCGISAFAQDKAELPEWTADNDAVTRLGDVFADSRISIRPPRSLKRADKPDPPELAKRGVHNYGWTPRGAFPSLENLSVVLAPFAQPSAVALDKTIEGMKGAIQRSLQDVKFGEVRSGKFRGIEARSGEYTAQIAGRPITAFYLVGIDDTGSFALTAMLPSSEVTPEKAEELKASILTFRRVK